VYNLRPLNSPTHYLSLLAFNSLPSLHIRTPPHSRWNWKKTAGSR